MVEAVRLVVWDLDETFWKGTLSEGRVELIASHCELIKTLASRGIVSSICSKNDPEPVERVLKDAEMWEYFVLPSINWEPKGPRLKELIEDIQLRPASVMFIDDHHLNREEVRRLLPDMQVSDESIIARMGDMPAFCGKPDPQLTRLNQYKMLARRKTAAAAGAGNSIEFLRSCDIRVRIEHNILPHLNRAIELINRTNQLNYLKNRLPEDSSQAAVELTALLQRHDVHAGLVRVVDRYGDHGLCGIYIQKQSGQLLQFAFSCRILGMGVERWLYQRLGRPPLPVIGEVLTDPVNDATPVEWIRVAPVEEPSETPALERIGRVLARGGCDLNAVCHYFSVGAYEAHGEFNLHRDGCDARIDHSIFLRYAITGLSSGALEASHAVGYENSDFSTVLITPFVGATVWLLSFWTDTAYALYRHRGTGIMLPFMVPGWSDHRQDARKSFVADLPPGYIGSRYAEALQVLTDHFDFIGTISESLFKENLRIILEAAPSKASRFILGAKEERWDGVAKGRHRSAANRALNKWTREVTRYRRKVRFLNVRDFVNSESEVHDWGHFDRMIYFRIYEYILRQIERSPPRRLLGRQ